MRFAATFTNDFTGWQKVTLPFSSFSRTSPISRTNKLAAPPNDGLTLTEMWGYRLNASADSQGNFYLDNVALAQSMKLYLPIVLK